MEAENSRLCFHLQTRQGGNVSLFLFVHWSGCGLREHAGQFGVAIGVLLNALSSV